MSNTFPNASGALHRGHFNPLVPTHVCDAREMHDLHIECPHVRLKTGMLGFKGLLENNPWQLLHFRASSRMLRGMSFLDESVSSIGCVIDWCASVLERAGCSISHDSKLTSCGSILERVPSFPTSMEIEGSMEGSTSSTWSSLKRTLKASPDEITGAESA